MKEIIGWFASKPVVANLLAGFSVLAGLSALAVIPVKLVPEVDLSTIMVSLPYLGAAPEDVESGVCARIEEGLEGIVGIDSVESIADEGLCTVRIRLRHDADDRAVFGKVDTQVNAIDTFPEETERPVIRFLDAAKIVAEVAVTGPRDLRALKELGRQVRDDLLKLPGISRVRIANNWPYEISVEVSAASLLRNNLTFDDVAAAVRQRSVDLPGGQVRTDSGELLLRTSGQAYRGTELAQLVVTTRDDGTRVRLGDVARVVDGFEDTHQSLSFNGKPAALVQVLRTGEQDMRAISKAVKDFIAESVDKYPAGVALVLRGDESTAVTERLTVLADSGVQGIFLVLILLALFLRPHLALWVSAGIPIALLGALALVYWSGFSLDSMSLTGFIVALGMIVDDAVVVGEGAHRAQQRGVGQLAGAIEGAHEVLVPVTFGVLTTLVAFAPLLFLDGMTGALVKVQAATVILCLVVSLAECQAVLPAHLGHRSERFALGDFGMTLLVLLIIGAFMVAPDWQWGVGLSVFAMASVWAVHLLGFLGQLGDGFAKVQLKFEYGLKRIIEVRFRSLVAAALRNRLITLALGFSAFASAVGVVAGGHLPFTLLLPVQGDQVIARLTMPLGVNADETAQAIAGLAGSARQLREELAEEDGRSPILHVMEALGGHPSKTMAFAGERSESGSHLGEVSIQLVPYGERSLTPQQIADRWRDLSGPVARAEELEFTADRLDIDSGIEIRLSGADLTVLHAASLALRDKLAEYPGVYSIADTYQQGKEELNLSITPQGEALGLTLSDLGRQVRQAFYGEEAQRVQRGRDDVRIMVRYTAAERGSIDSVYGLRIRVPSGGEVPFRTVAEVERGRGLSSITRVDGERSITVTAKVDLIQTSARSVLSDLQIAFLPDLVARYAGVSYALESLRQQSEAGASLLLPFLLALFVMFSLLAIPLNSYTQPLIVMSVVPFAFVGAVWGHLLMKGFGNVVGLSMPSIFGMVGASGVVINSALILVHGVNRFRAEGDSMQDALVNATVSRCRPILITTLTTFVGLAPLLLSRSVHSQTLVPLTASLAYGVLFTSVATLLVLPAFWLTLHKLRNREREAMDGR